MGRNHWPALGAALAVVLAACGGPTSRGFEIGLKRVAVDLSFADPSKAPPPTVLTVNQVLAAPPPPVATGFVTSVAPPVLRVEPPHVPVRHPVEQCPKAGADAHPQVPVRVFATTDPDSGVYTTHNAGSFTWGIGLGAISGPYPKRSLFELKNVHHDQTSDPANGVTKYIYYDIVETQIDGAEVSTTYRTSFIPSSLQGQVQRNATVGPEPMGALELIKVVRHAPGSAATEFNPIPAVTIMAFKSGEGTSWTSAGIDKDTNTSLAVQGSILSRELVDVCGKVYDTYRVSSTERYTNLTTGFSSSTDAQDPNIYSVATQLGGIFVARHVSTTTTSPAANGSTNTFVLKYTSVLDSITPEALP